MKKWIAGLCAAALITPAAFAHDGNAATSASGQKGLFNLIYGENLCHGQWAFSTYYNKWDRRVQSDPVTEAFDPLWTDWDMDVDRLSVAVGYGITDRIELSLMLPYYQFEGDSIHGENRSVGILNGQLFNQGVIDQSGLGNLRIGAKFQLARTEDYATALMAYVDAPTGDDDEAIVTGDPGLGLLFAMNNSAGWVFNLGYFDPGDSDFLEVSDEISVGVGYAKEFGRTEWITELSSILYTDSNGEHDATDIASGGRWRLSNPDWAFNAALRVDLSDTSFDYTPIGGLIGLSYSPKNRYSLTVNNIGSGTGTVRGDGIDCGNQCSNTYYCGGTIELVAEPDPKSRFDGWEGDCAGSNETVTITLDGDKTCSARYVKLYDVTVDIARIKHPDGDTPGNGTVKIGDQDCTDSCTVTVDTGTDVGLMAAPAETSTFEGWTVDCSGDDPSTSVTADSDKTCVATFMGPPKPCVDMPSMARYPKCGRYDVSYSCDSATWSQIIDGFAMGSGDINMEQIPADDNERKTPLCDVVNFLRACPSVSVCVAGRELETEAHCTAEERASYVYGFIISQADFPFFKDVTHTRVDMAPVCDAEGGTGQSVEIFIDN